MSMHPEPIFDVPELTATVAKAAFPKGNRYMKMGCVANNLCKIHAGRVKRIG